MSNEHVVPSSSAVVNITAASSSPPHSSIRLIRYSPKALAVLGPSKPFKDALKELGGKWNSALTISGKKEGGWIFSATKKEALETLLKMKEEDPSSASVSGAAAIALVTSGPPAAVTHSDVLFFTEPTTNDFIIIGREKTFARIDDLKNAGGIWSGGFRFPTSARAAVDAILSAPEPAKSRKRGRAQEEKETDNADNADEVE